MSELNAFRELTIALLKLGIFMQEDSSQKSRAVKDLERQFPGALVGASGRDGALINDVRDLQKRLNEKVGKSTFGIKEVKSRAYGDKIYVVIPENIIDLLEAKDALGIAEDLTSSSADDVSF